RSAVYETFTRLPGDGAAYGHGPSRPSAFWVYVASASGHSLLLSGPHSSGARVRDAAVRVHACGGSHSRASALGATPTRTGLHGQGTSRRCSGKARRHEGARRPASTGRHGIAKIQFL